MMLLNFSIPVILGDTKKIDTEKVLLLIKAYHVETDENAR